MEKRPRLGETAGQWRGPAGECRGEGPAEVTWRSVRDWERLLASGEGQLESAAWGGAVRAAGRRGAAYGRLEAAYGRLEAAYGRLGAASGRLGAASGGVVSSQGPGSVEAGAGQRGGRGRAAWRRGAGEEAAAGGGDTGEGAAAGGGDTGEEAAAGGSARDCVALAGVVTPG